MNIEPSAAKGLIQALHRTCGKQGILNDEVEEAKMYSNRQLSKNQLNILSSPEIPD